MRFRIQRQSNGHLGIGLSVNVKMTDAIEMFEHGYLSFSGDALDQPLPATGNDHINETLKTH